MHTVGGSTEGAGHGGDDDAARVWISCSCPWTHREGYLIVRGSKLGQSNDREHHASCCGYDAS